ncbi:MAG: AmmeMemoRadiSam system protein B [Anaerolineae bacterium]|nr:AmmeMemoRadiSam system protein B [Anaerolineae bacterium]
MSMKPKLRNVQVHPMQHQGQPMLLLQDPLGLSPTTIAVPRPLGPVLMLMDGSRDLAQIDAALQVRAGVKLAPGLLERLVSDLDEALLLDNERSVSARGEAVAAYRQAPYRPLTLDGASFSADPRQASAQLQAYVDTLAPAEASAETRSIRGVVSPHIDYQRGGPVYAQVWRDAAAAAREAELAIFFGTDHQGSPGTLTLTRQSYATPWGTLPTDAEALDALVKALGEEAAFEEELHHRTEHSIELAAVWLHFVRGGEPLPIVPVLCGSFGAFVEGEGHPAGHEPFQAAVDALRPLMAARRTLIVAAADLAHVGPAFGGQPIVDFIARGQLQNADQRLLETMYAGDAEAFFSQIQAEGDRRNVCGLPPIYLTLRLLGESKGTPAGYAVCPADPQGTSLVTIAGIVLV